MLVMNRTRTDFADRMRSARQRAGLSQAAVCRHLGLSQGTLSEAERIAHGSSRVTEFAELYQVNPHWLATGHGDMDNPPGRGVSRAMSPATGDDVVIPQFDTGGSMGEGLVLRDQPGVIRGWRVSPEWLQKNVRQAATHDKLCIVTGFGDSMRPMFNPGDPLLVDLATTKVDYDAIYFFRVESEGFIKRLQRIPGQGLIAISENKAYRDWTITPDMDFQVFGRVLKVWRGEEY
jgi:DNA-binding XRE family transcriptional regulator